AHEITHAGTKSVVMDRRLSEEREMRHNSVSRIKIDVSIRIRCRDRRGTQDEEMNDNKAE
ncbi:hypothetical protein, partial [Burkholderia sp. Ac-20345]|uniref:hypothetical protein n=1 Tax=Burkholderia sp. Ac-20345 TaxID=2703891 RepID=UPI00197C765C